MQRFCKRAQMETISHGLIPILPSAAKSYAKLAFFANKTIKKQQKMVYSILKYSRHFAFPIKMPILKQKFFFAKTYDLMIFKKNSLQNE